MSRPWDTARQGKGAFTDPKNDNVIAFDYARAGSHRTQIVRTRGHAQLQASRPDAIAWHINQSGELTASDTAYALQANASFSYQGIGARRLTPRECERLMGWPDDWTRYDADGRELADTTRYRMCGNGVVAPVAAWLGRRLRAETRRQTEQT